ncbi:MAG: GAF domain-containing protein [Anaerolineae bacterium]|nr:GAF domain-containing protein [Anaerolineae bacterium]
MTTHTLSRPAMAGTFDQLDLLVGVSPFGIAVFDREMRYVMANQHWIDDYQLDDASLIGLSHYDIFPDTPTYWKELHQRALNGENLANEFDHFKNDNGTVQTFNWRMFPWYAKTNRVRNGNGYDTKPMPDGIVVMMRNITSVLNDEATPSVLQENLQRAQELETMAEVSAAAASILDVTKLLQTVVDLTKERFGFYHAHVYLLNAAGDALEMATGTGEAGRMMRERGHRIAFDHPASLVARCARSQQAVIVNDVRSAPDFLPNKLLPDTRSEMAVPMVVGDKLVGVLDLQSDRPGNFTEAKAHIQTILGNQIAVAVQNARSFAQTEQARLYTQRLAEIDSALAQSDNEEQVLSLLSTFAGRLNVAGTALYFTETDDHDSLLGVRTAAVMTPDGNFVPLSTQPKLFLTRDEFPVFDLIISNPNEPLFVEDVATDPRAEGGIIRNFLNALQIKSLIVIPLRTGNKWKGLISFRWTSAQTFPAEIRAICTSIIPTASAVIASRRAALAQEIVLQENVARAQELETVAEVSSVAATVLDLNTVLQTVVNLAKQRFNLYHAHIYLLNAEGDKLELAFGAGEAGKLMRERGHRIAVDHPASLVARCARSHEAVIVNDVRSAPDFLPNPLLPDTRSEMAVPMVVGDKLVGVLDLQSDTVGNFTESKARIQTILGNQIAVAVQNARTYLNVQDNNKLLDSIVNGTPDWIFLKDRNFRYVMVNEAFATWYGNRKPEDMIGKDDYDLGTPAYLIEGDPAQGIRGFRADDVDVLTTGQLIENPNDVVNYADGTLHIFDTKKIPLRNAAGDIIGVLGTSRDITQGKKAEEEVKTRASELETVTKVSSTVATNLNLDELLQTAVEMIKTDFGFYHAHIYLLDEASGHLVLTSGAGEAGRIMRERGHRIAFDHPASLVARCARSHEAVIVNDVQSAPDFLPNKLLPDTRAEMTVPMVVGDKLVGVLDLQSEKVDNFTEVKARIQTILGNQIAVAVQNARTYLNVQDNNKLLDSIVNGTPDWIFLKDRNFRYVMVNEAFATWYGNRKPEDMIGKDDYDLGTPAYLIEGDPAQGIRGFRADDVDVLTTGQLIENPNDVVNYADGTLHIFDTKKIPLRNAAGDIIGVLGTSRDITESKRAEEEIRTRASELETVANVSSNAATNLNLDELLQTAVEMIKTDFGLYHAHVYLLNAEGEKLELAAGAGEAGRLMKARSHRIAIGHPTSIVARCARSHEAVLVNDVTQAQNFLPNPLLPNTRAEMAVPMVVGDKLVGVLDLQSDLADNFTEVKARIQTILGNQIAVAVQNARSFAQTEQGRLRAQQLAEVDSALAQAENEEQVLKLLSNFAGHLSAANAALYFAKTDENGDLLALQAAAVVTSDGTSIPISSLPTSYLTKNDFPILQMLIDNPDEPIFIEDVFNDPRTTTGIIRDFMAALKVTALIAIPLKTAKWEGIISFRWSEPQSFSPQTRDVFTSIIPTASAVIASRRAALAQEAALQENVARAQELETVANVSSVVASLLAVDKLLQTVVDLTKERFNLYHAHVYLLNEAGDTLELAAGAGEAGRIMRERGHRIAFDHPASLVARCARSREAVIVNDVTQAPDFLPNVLLPNTRAEMAVPMVVGDTLVGVLDLQSEKPDYFTELKARIKTVLGNQVAVAIQNARQYGQQAEIAEQLRKVDRLKSEFLASMSHELRTPLNSIIGYSRMLLDGVSGDLPEEVNEDLGAIHYGGQHLLSLINDILDLAKIEAGRLDIDPHPVDLFQLAEEVGRMTSVLVKDKPVSIVFDLDPDMPPLQADLVRVRQILNNLISNAIKFTERGEVRLTASYEPGADMVLLNVSDTGMGIESDRVPYVFERFYQADSSSSRKAGGTGLGLTITQHLVNMHGGRIWVESTLGQGSNFYFTLPIVKEEAAVQ